MTQLDTRAASAAELVLAELVRNRLEATAEEAAVTIGRTSVSPVVTESFDFSTTILDPAGRLLAVGGYVIGHAYVSAHAVRCTVAQYTDIAEGDVFIANDPHAGGGYHPNDVVVQRPIFHDGVLVGWAALSAHMVDMGGMTPGSFAFDARDCYGEALRLPTVRLVRRGEDLGDIWRIILNNVRSADQVEMDLRGLVAGSFVAQERVREIVAETTLLAFQASTELLLTTTERELRARVRSIRDGEFRVRNWVEWQGEFLPVQCTLHKRDGQLSFDFTGTTAQVPYFINSKPYIVKSGIGQALRQLLGYDLPLNEGVFAPIDVVCPSRTLLNCEVPAPISAAHIHSAHLAYEVACEGVRLALAASEASEARARLIGWKSTLALGPLVWSYEDGSGKPGFFKRSEGAITGSSAGAGRDGMDLTKALLGNEIAYALTDVEITEDREPVLIRSFGHRRSTEGAGEFVAGAGCEITYEPYGIDQATGFSWGTRNWLPVQGGAGGFPGPRNEHWLLRKDGTTTAIPDKRAVLMGPGDVFLSRSASGGGWGDPLDRDPARVASDVAESRLSPDQAASVYGVVLDATGDAVADETAALRAKLRAERLARGHPPRRPLQDSDVASLSAHPAGPLYVGIEQRGPVAYSTRTGTPLAVSPHPWTDGCAVLEEVLEHPTGVLGPTVVVRTYLDPTDGCCLFVEAVPEGEGATFTSLPRRWTQCAVDGQVPASS